MSHQQTSSSSEYRCDEEGCGERHVGSINNLKQTWREAEQFGWRTTVTYMQDIVRRIHLCPSHAKVWGLTRKVTFE
jgi:hypothetical protein